MLGIIFISLVKCSIAGDYHLYYYDLLKNNFKLTIALTAISLLVLTIGSLSPFITMMPMVGMVLKYAIYRFSVEVDRVEWLKNLLGNNTLEKVKNALSDLDSFPLAIPLLSILVTYFLMVILELAFFIFVFLLMYIVADYAGLSFKSDTNILMIAGISMVVIGMLFIYILRKIKNIMITTICCQYFSLFLLTCLEILGYANLQMKEYFSDDKRAIEFSTEGFLVVLIGFCSVLCQYLLYPTLSNIRFTEKEENSLKVEPAAINLVNMQLENNDLKDRLEKLEKHLDKKEHSEAYKICLRKQ
ncbi:hypothetical protein NGRA_0137 [Nosema granulosis]|uniref:Uncharacterized protein n=1 Tax=Nosema granulosis TaxID=83296 RepID=A0A9P6H2K5_9MICR|nr:hypothetical protein NGRA_0137 [Nosema granulosis]